MATELAQKVASIQKKMDEDVADIKRIENGKKHTHSLQCRVPQGNLEQGDHACEEV